MGIPENSREDLTRYYEYLDELRESGVTNMYGAAPYLAAKFRMPRGQSRDVLKLWMDSFGDGTEPAHVRANK